MRNVLYKNGKILFIDEIDVFHEDNNHYYYYTTITLISSDGKIIDKIHIDSSKDTLKERKNKNRYIRDIVADYFDVPRIGKLPNGFNDEHVLMWVPTDENGNPLWKMTAKKAEEEYNSDEMLVFLDWKLLTNFRYSQGGINRDKKWRIKLL